jgi:hypothetical protein
MKRPKAMKNKKRTSSDTDHPPAKHWKQRYSKYIKLANNKLVLFPVLIGALLLLSSLSFVGFHALVVNHEVAKLPTWDGVTDREGIWTLVQQVSSNSSCFHNVVLSPSTHLLLHPPYLYLR